MVRMRLVVLWCVLGLIGTATSSSIQNECKTTRYPSLCVQTLKGLSDSRSYQYGDMISVLVNKTLAESNLPSNLASSLLTTKLGESQSVSDECERLASLSTKRLEQSLAALNTADTSNKEDILTWLSAALTYQQACKESADQSSAASHISKKMARLTELSSNALALANRLTGAKTGTERISPAVRRLLQSPAATVRANAVVAQDGSGDYRSVSEAIHAASGARFVIYVKAGVYKEKIRTNKDGITLIGEGKYTTVITGDHSVAGGISMPNTATFTVTGDGFIARDIGFQNTAGPQGKQALALYIASDHSALYRCSITGYQDTLYALSLRQFYRECDISGTVDFIFGNSAAVFQNCNIILRRPRRGGSNVILASGRSDPGQNTGFSVQNCRITASSELSPVKHSVKSYLGRPWKAYSRAVVMQSSIDDEILPVGWIEWPGYGSSVLKTLYFAEYANVGPGAGTGKRVRWSGYRVIGAGEAASFTVARFISGNSWLPSTRVAYDSGL